MLIHVSFAVDLPESHAGADVVSIAEQLCSNARLQLAREREADAEVLDSIEDAAEIGARSAIVMKAALEQAVESLGGCMRELEFVFEDEPLPTSRRKR